MATQVDSGLMDGFVIAARFSSASDGVFALSYYEQSDLPFYYWLASTYALNDRHFPAVRSGTFPNRDYLLLGTSDGVVDTGDYPHPDTPTIFDAFDRAGVTWRAYSDGSLFSGSLGWDLTHKNTGRFADFIADLDGATLPQVAFVDGLDNVEDKSIRPAICNTARRGRVISTSTRSPAVTGMRWRSFGRTTKPAVFDHVPPPDNLCVARPQDADFHLAGVRVH